MSGPLPNKNQETIAQERAKGKSWEDACRAAGLNPKSGYRARVARHPGIAARIKELTDHAALKAAELFGPIDDALAVTSKFLIARAEEARQLAMSLDQPAAAVTAIHAMAKLAGVWIDKRENTNRNVDQLTDAELAEYLVRSGGAALAQEKADQGKLS